MKSSDPLIKRNNPIRLSAGARNPQRVPNLVPTKLVGVGLDGPLAVIDEWDRFRPSP